MENSPVETKKDFGEGDSGFVKRWFSALSLSSKSESKWRKQGVEINKIYRSNKSDSFNILFSNTQTLRSSVYQRTPRPDVRRRFKDEDSVAKQASEVLERALIYSLDEYDFDSVVINALDDSLLQGRGVARVVYDPTLEVAEEETIDEDTGELITQEVERKTYESVQCKYVYWGDIRFGRARVFEELPWMAFKHVMAKDDIIRNFGEKHSDVPLDYNIDGDSIEQNRDAPQDTFKRAEVWEFWDKETREVFFLASGYDKVLKKTEDPYELTDFWPIPKPMYSIKTTDSLLPVPEYDVYKVLAEELNTVTARINSITKAIKIVGIYDAVQEELAGLIQGTDNQMIGIKKYKELMDKGGLQTAIQFLPIEETARVLSHLYRSREETKQAIFEITGISDIMRGQGMASETATAQRIKGQFGTLRIQERQRELNRFVRDILRLKAELIAEKFDKDVLELITGIEIEEEVIDLLRDDGLRSYNVDIETDSTINSDEQADKEAAVELLTSLTQFASSWLPLSQAMIQGGADPAAVNDAIQEMALFGVRKFKGSRGIEESVQKLLTPQEQPQPQANELAVIQGGLDGISS